MKTKILSVHYYKAVPITAPEYYVKDQNRITDVFNFKIENEPENVYQTYGEVGLFGIDRNRNKNMIFGTFAFTQTENLPPKQNRKSKQTQNLELEDDDGLGYQTSFLFDKKTNIIAIVSRRPGVNIKSIESYIRQNTDAPAFRFEHVAYESSYQNFLKTNSYKKLKVKLAHPTDIIPLLKNQGMANMEINSLIKRFGADKLSFEVTTTTKESLPINAVRDVVNTLRKVTTGNVQTLEVVGNDEDIEEKTFNFITNRISDKISVEITRHGEFRTKEVYEQLELRFQDHSVFFRTHFKNRIE